MNKAYEANNCTVDDANSPIAAPLASHVALSCSDTESPQCPDSATGWWTRLSRRLFRQAATPTLRPPYSQLLEGRALAKGDLIHLTWEGKLLALRVDETTPGGTVRIHGSTTLSIQDTTEGQDPAVSYRDVGGLGKEIGRVREMVELPLRSPEIFRHLGIDPPKGLLLYGPPGCGKTLIARAVAYESGAHFINVNGPEIIQKHYGESEEMLRGIFDEAEKYPASIIFFDEIDALAPNRETVLGDVEKRVVAQLLALMDGLRSRGQIIVIAATNLPNNIDPALRRPGRFDREIAINPPDKTGRLEILRIHARHMPLADNVSLERLAALTHGFLGADLAALCRESAMNCARETLRQRRFTKALAGAEDLTALRVDMAHFETALGEIELSTTRQVNTDIADVKWDAVGGLENIKQLLKEAVEWPLKYQTRFAYAHTVPPKGILLTGAPGTGKTLIARAVAGEAEINFISVRGPELLSKWVGESERGIREAFKRARQSAPSILFFDELDAIVPARGSGEGGVVSERMVGQFLLEMDSIGDMTGVVVLAATGRPDLIDKALLRPGRFDFIIELPEPDLPTRLSILQIHCRGRKLHHDVDLAKIAGITAGMSGADLEALCRRAAMQGIRESIAAHPGQRFPPFALTMRHFDTALAEIGGHSARGTTASIV